jgi:hypothetical protein
MNLARSLPVLCALLACMQVADAAVIAADAQTLGATTQLAERLPPAQEFTVTAAGQVRVTLADLAAPQAFTQLRLLVSRGATNVATLTSAGTQQFAATPGTYKVQVTGVPAQQTSTAGPAGTFDVEVRELTGNTVLKHFADGIAALPAPPTAQSGFDTTFEIAQAGTYQVKLNDRSFPAALSAVDLLLVRADGGDAPVTLSGPCTAQAGCTVSFTAAAGSYDLIVVATASGSDQAGLYSIAISGGPLAAVAYASTQPVGRLPLPTSIELPASGAYTLAATDHAIPAALSTLRLRLIKGADLLATLDVAGATPASSAFTVPAAGAAQLFVFSRAPTGAGGGTGVFSIGVSQGTQAVYRDLRTLPAGYDSTVGAGGYRFAFTAPSAANYLFRLRDLAFPFAFSQLRAVIVQNGVVVQNVTTVNSETTVPLVNGPAFLAVLGIPATATANSLMGLSLVPQAGGTALLDQAQGVGPLFATRVVNIPAAGSYDLSINDLQFPAAFTELAVAVTRGPELIGQVFGSDRIRFTAQAGAHSINLLARPDATAQYATWGFQLADSPPAPVVSLAANPAAVSRDATTSLTWSATGATGCTASGGWNGARALTGTETTVAINVDTVFTLACTGDGGSTSRSVTVTVAASSGGGGGALGLGALLALALLTVRQLRMRRA